MASNNGLDIRAQRTGQPQVIAACAKHGNQPDALLEVLIDVQNQLGCVHDDAVRVIAQTLNLSRAEVHGVRSFYTDFSTEPKARIVIKLCRAEACRAVGSEEIAASLVKHFGVEFGAADADSAVALESVYCLGNCALGPTAMINDRLIGRANLTKITQMQTDVASV